MRTFTTSQSIVCIDALPVQSEQIGRENSPYFDPNYKEFGHVKMCGWLLLFFSSNVCGDTELKIGMIFFIYFRNRKPGFYVHGEVGSKSSKLIAQDSCSGPGWSFLLDHGFRA